MQLRVESVNRFWLFMATAEDGAMYFSNTKRNRYAWYYAGMLILGGLTNGNMLIILILAICLSHMVIYFHHPILPHPLGFSYAHHTVVCILHVGHTSCYLLVCWIDRTWGHYRVDGENLHTSILMDSYKVLSHRFYLTRVNTSIWTSEFGAMLSLILDTTWWSPLLRQKHGSRT